MPGFVKPSFKVAKLGQAISLANLGIGIDLVAGFSLNEYTIRTLLAGDHITLTVTPDGEVLFDVIWPVLPDVIGANVGTGLGIYKDKTGDTLNFHKLLAGSNVTITLAGDDLVIASTGGGGGGEINTSSTLGTGATIVASKVGNDLPFRSFLSSAGLLWTQATNEVTLSLDATLIALAGITTAANTLIYATGVDTFNTTGLSVFGRSLIDDADAPTARATLGLANSVTRDVTTSPTDTTSERLWRTNDLVKQTSLSDATAGRIQINGAHGNGGQVISTEVDVFNYKTGGRYITPASGLLNLPSGWVQGRQLVEVIGGTNYTAVTIYGGSTNLRRKASNTWNGAAWSGWIEYWHSNNFDPSLKANITYVDTGLAGKVAYQVAAQRVKLDATIADNANYIGFYNSDGTTRYGILGKSNVGSDTTMYLYADTGNADVYSVTGAARLIHANALKLTTTSTGITVTGIVTATSDKKYKSKVKKLTGSLARILSLKPKSYFFSLLNAVQFGFIAQDVKKVYPNSVHRIKEDGRKSSLVLSKDEIIADLVVVAQMQENRIQRLEAIINDLAK